MPTGIPIPLLPETSCLLPTSRLPKAVEKDFIGLAIDALPESRNGNDVVTKSPD